MIRALEWNDPKARYPNLWLDGMPVQIMAYDTIAMRLRLGDLIAVFYPASQRHPGRSGRFLGISRVVGLRKAHVPGSCWIDLETAHRLQSPIRPEAAPRRVFLRCDPGWPDQEVALFREVYRAAVGEGWVPTPEEASEDEVDQDTPPAPLPVTPVSGQPAPEASGGVESVHEEAAAPSTPAHAAEKGGRFFAGVHYGGDMRDPRDGTWIAFGRLDADGLRVVRLEATGRHGLQAYLRDPDRTLMNVEAIGLGFPFAMPAPFNENLLGGTWPEDGWWGLARRFERLSYPDFLVALQEFRDRNGDVKRFTDEQAGAPSPLDRSSRDAGPALYHGVRMIAEERSRYVVRPFESAQGRLLLEVQPSTWLRRLEREGAVPNGTATAATVLDTLAGLPDLPLHVAGDVRSRCRGRREALRAVLAARCAAAAVLSGEAGRSPEELARDSAERIRREGWIYGLGSPVAEAGPEPGPSPAGESTPTTEDPA